MAKRASTVISTSAQDGKRQKLNPVNNATGDNRAAAAAPVDLQALDAQGKRDLTVPDHEILT